MHYFTPEELNALLTTAHKHSKVHHLALLVSVGRGLRVSECLELTPDDVQGEKYLLCRRKKGSVRQLQSLHKSAHPLFNEMALVEYAAKVRASGQARLFDFCRQYADRLIRRYGAEAGIAAEKCHWHSLKHSTAMLVWSESLSLSQVQQALGHADYHSSLIYLREHDARLAAQSLDRALEKAATAAQGD
jgi:site-specific recombinase XerD